jgi:hypothetical protein
MEYVSRVAVLEARAGFTSFVTLTEVLVHPLRSGNQKSQRPIATYSLIPRTFKHYRLQQILLSRQQIYAFATISRLFIDERLLPTSQTARFSSRTSFRCVRMR